MAAAAFESMSLVDLGHVYPIDQVVVLDRDGLLSCLGQLPGVALRGFVAIQLTDLNLFFTVQRETVTPRAARGWLGHSITIQTIDAADGRRETRKRPKAEILDRSRVNFQKSGNGSAYHGRSPP